MFDVIASPYRNLIPISPSSSRAQACRRILIISARLYGNLTLRDPDWLKRLRPDVPTAYVSMGSTGDANNMRRILVSLRDAGWQVMTTVGRHGGSSAGVFTTPFARGSTLLRQSDVMICHGGSGTVYQAVSQGVPIIGVATFHDQEINLERVEALNWGVALDPFEWDEADLLAAARSVCLPPYTSAVAEGQREILRCIEEAEKTPLLGAHAI